MPDDIVRRDDTLDGYDTHDDSPKPDDEDTDSYARQMSVLPQRRSRAARTTRRCVRAL